MNSCRCFRLTDVATYVRMKLKAAEEVNISLHMPHTFSYSFNNRLASIVNLSNTPRLFQKPNYLRISPV